MPTFTEASLIAAGTGALLWVVLAAEASTRRRTWVGLAGFVVLEAATFSRYTNIVVLACAVIAVTWLRGRRAGGQRAAAARRDLAVALALAACWAAVWVLYATYTWTAVPRLSTLQAARFYVPALGAAWHPAGPDPAGI